MTPRGNGACTAMPRGTPFCDAPQAVSRAIPHTRTNAQAVLPFPATVMSFGRTADNDGSAHQPAPFSALNAVDSVIDRPLPVQPLRWIRGSIALCRCNPCDGFGDSSGKPGVDSGIHRVGRWLGRDGFGHSSCPGTPLPGAQPRIFRDHAKAFMIAEDRRSEARWIRASTPAICHLAT